jgi:predicted porin
MIKPALKSGVVAVLWMISVPSIAQSSLTLYARIDNGFEYVSHNGSTGGSLVRLFGPQLQADAFGLRGEEQIGGDLSAIFKLENGFNPNTGALTQGGRLFGRQAWVGLKDSHDQIQLGRVYTPLYDVFGQFDPAWYSNASLLTQDAGFTSRVDNGVRYTRTEGPLRANIVYSFGQDVVDTPIGGPNSSSANAKELSASFDYSNGYLMTALGYDHIHGPLTSGEYGLGLFVPALVPTSTSSADDVTRIAAGGRYTFHASTLYAGYRYLHVSVSGITHASNLYWVGIAQRFGRAFTLDFGVYHQKVARFPASSTSVVAQGQYALSKSTSLYASAGAIWNSARSDMGIDTQTQTRPGQSQISITLGMYQSF